MLLNANRSPMVSGSNAVRIRLAGPIEQMIEEEEDDHGNDQEQDSELPRSEGYEEDEADLAPHKVQSNNKSDGKQQASSSTSHFYLPTIRWIPEKSLLPALLFRPTIHSPLPQRLG